MNIYLFENKNKKPHISTQSVPFHLTSAMLVSWGYTFNESDINLSSLNIGSLEANLFSKFVCLKKLTLKRNKILRLYQDTFKNCNCLTHLDMSFNRLSQLQQGDFDGAFNLDTIYLNNNLIEHISLNTFLNLPKIVNFNISNNPIAVIYNFTLSNGVLTSTFIG
jgi:hypothetical protein